MNSNCPVCGYRDIQYILSRNEIPVLQNIVYASREDAIEAPSGDFELVMCSSCGFAFNRKFDESKIVYDVHYDNAVPSELFYNYYKALITHLDSSYDLTSGPVIDIGCGKGKFIQMMAAQLPEVSAIGLDPSYEEARLNGATNLSFHKDVFRSEYVSSRPSLLVCRHVLEHVSDPKKFLNVIANAVQKYSSVPILVEVPDLEWIIESGAFWDFCYEHVSYFTIPSVSYLLQISGFRVNKITKAFGGQYLWIEAQTIQSQALPGPFDVPGAKLLSRALRYAEKESANIIFAIEQLKKLVADGYSVVVWGMSTKGVLFTHLTDPGNKYVTACIDINRYKQGKYTPVSGHRISPPSMLTELAREKVFVIIMNPNYKEEIKQQAGEYHTDLIFADASFSVL